MSSLCRDCLMMFPAPEAGCPVCGGTRIVVHAELERLAIAHVDCDSFYASVEKRDRPDLVDKPLIVGHPGGRGVVTTACYIARKSGARSAMPMFQAMRLCPEAVVLPPDMDKYRRVSNTIRRIMAAESDCLEPVSLDEAYLDLTPVHGRSDDPPAVALARIANRVEQAERITVSIGLGANKFLAKLASDMDKPRGFAVIGVAEAPRVLAPMPVGRINGVGPVLQRKLEGQGIRTIGQLQRLSEIKLLTQFGKFGRRLSQYSHGLDDREITPARPVKSISKETTFDSDIRSPEALIDALRPLCSKVGERTKAKGVAGHTVVLKLKTADFRTLTRNQKLVHPTQRGSAIFSAASSLLLREATGQAAYRLVGVGLADLCPPEYADPPDLFGGVFDYH